MVNVKVMYSNSLFINILKCQKLNIESSQTWSRPIFQAFITYIRSILEYSSIVWNLINLIDSIENVQRSFSKRIPSLPSLLMLND
jgi:hypothetical protein